LLASLRKGEKYIKLTLSWLINQTATQGILSDLSVRSGNYKGNNFDILRSASGVKDIAAQEKIFLFPLITFTPDRIYYTSGCLAGLTTKDGLTAVIFHHKCCWANGGHH